ncbi:MAG: hypothetical protein WCP69_15350 [Bacteroidota bacterium]
MKIKLIMITLMITLCSCDCYLRVQSVIVDSKTKLPIVNSGITDYKNCVRDSSEFVYSDSNGRFQYFARTTSLFGCPKVVLLIRKSGYEDLIKKYPSCCAKNDTIRLKQINK